MAEEIIISGRSIEDHAKEGSVYGMAGASDH